MWLKHMMKRLLCKLLLQCLWTCWFMDQQLISICRAIIEECTDLMQYSIWPKELRITYWQWLQWDWLCFVVSLLRAADMKLFAKPSCQGSICTLCKWIEQLMLTSLNKTKIQIWKPYSSQSLSFFCPPTHLLFSCTVTRKHMARFLYCSSHFRPCV